MGSRITRQELENGIAAINRKIGFIRSHLLSETDATMKMLYRFIKKANHISALSA